MENQAQVSNPNIGGPQAEPVPQTPQLSINELLVLRAVVDTAVRRGAFQGSELSTVGAAFDKLNAFLNAVAPQQSTNETTEAPEA
jgi:hypothetical protein